MSDFGRPWSSEEETLLRQMYLTGVSYREMSATLDRSESAVNSRAFKLNLKRPLDIGLRWRPWPEDQLAFAENAYLKGFSAATIAEMMGRTKISVKRMITSRGWSDQPRLVPLPDIFDTPSERWKRVDISNHYAVSNRGRVMSLHVGHLGEPLKQWLCKNGYWHVTLQGGSEKKRYFVHRLVAVAFLGAPPTPEHQVAHGNGDSSDNDVGNLRWATPAENQSDRVLHGTDARSPIKGVALGPPLWTRNQAVRERLFGVFF